VWIREQKKGKSADSIYLYRIHPSIRRTVSNLTVLTRATPCLPLNTLLTCSTYSKCHTCARARANTTKIRRTKYW
jgi:hypothetical protein